MSPIFLERLCVMPYTDRSALASEKSGSSGGNNSGGGRTIPLPDGVKGWSWGAFMFNVIWGVFNSVWLSLLCFVPYLGVLVVFYLGFKGREMAWRNRRWGSLEHFNRVQRRWSLCALALLLGPVLIGILIAIAVPDHKQLIGI